MAAVPRGAGARRPPVPPGHPDPRGFQLPVAAMRVPLAPQPSGSRPLLPVQLLLGLPDGQHGFVQRLQPPGLLPAPRARALWGGTASHGTRHEGHAGEGRTEGELGCRGASEWGPGVVPSSSPCPPHGSPRDRATRIGGRGQGEARGAFQGAPGSAAPGDRNGQGELTTAEAGTRGPQAERHPAPRNPPPHQPWARASGARRLPTPSSVLGSGRPLRPLGVGDRPGHRPPQRCLPTCPPLTGDEAPVLVRELRAGLGRGAAALRGLAAAGGLVAGLAEPPVGARPLQGDGGAGPGAPHAHRTPRGPAARGLATPDAPQKAQPPAPPSFPPPLRPRHLGTCRLLPAWASPRASVSSPGEWAQALTP